MKRKILVLLPVFIIISGFFTMRVLLGMKKDTPRRAPERNVKLVRTEEVLKGNIYADFSAYGRISTSQPVLLYSEVNGEIIGGDIQFKEGSTFKKGDLLLKIDDRQIRNEINSIKSDFLNALVSVLPEIKIDFPEEFDIWQDYFNSIDFNSKIIPIPETRNQKIKVFLTRFNVYKLFFTIRNLELRHEKHFIYAPFNGSIISAQLFPGSNARTGSLFGEIINLDSMEVEVQIPASELKWVDRNRPVRITSNEIAGEWSGRISRIDNSINEQNQTVSLYVSLDDGFDSVLNGIFVKADIPGVIISDSFRMPRNVIYQEMFIYIVKNGRLDYRKVEIAKKDKDEVIIRGGVDEGELFVTDILQGVSGGMPARTLDDTEEGGAAK